jgi:hypothetical protein
MGMVLKPGPMEPDMLECTKMERNKDRVNLYGVIKPPMKVSFRIIILKVLYYLDNFRNWRIRLG